MKYRKIKYKQKYIKGTTEIYRFLYNNKLQKGLIATYNINNNKIIYNYNINNIKTNTPKLYAIKIATKYFKNNFKKLIKTQNNHIFNIKDIEKKIIRGPYVLYTFLYKKNNIMWHLGKYNIK